MSKLNSAVHFRGETVTLFAVFKTPKGVPVVPLSPTVKVEYATAMGNIETILSATPMVQMSSERYYFNWEIPETAPHATFNVVYSGIVEGVTVKTTEELIVGDPNVTTHRNFLRYGSKSSLQKSRTTEPRLSPQLPKGEF